MSKWTNFIIIDRMETLQWIFRIISSLELQEDSIKFVKYLSAIAKRKLAFALSVFSSQKIILLDGKDILLIYIYFINDFFYRTNTWHGFKIETSILVKNQRYNI